MYHNNPVQIADAERKYIWPDVETQEPDVLLSIGTGKNSGHLAKEKKMSEDAEKPTIWMKMVPKMIKVAMARASDILDAQRIWDKFVVNVVRKGSNDRYIRINPELPTEPPRLDEKDKLWSLASDVKRSLNSATGQIRGVADRLVASCFYFEKASIQPQPGYITGK